MITQSLLLWLILVPLIGTAFLIPFSDKLVRWIALGTSGIGVILTVVLFCRFDGATSDQMQFVFSMPWVAQYGIRFALGIDGLSFPLVCLTKWMVPVALLASWHETQKVRAFMSCFLILDAAMTGTFLATDIFLFYVFWEMMLVPMLLLIGVWGGHNRIYASLKFFLYTFAGSVLMLVAIFWLFTSYREQIGAFTGDIQSLYRVAFPSTPLWLGLSVEDLIFWGFTIAFLIKVPLFPLHTWLPDAHVQAPTGGSILLAAVLLKMGTYGLLRFSIPFGPQAFIRSHSLLLALTLVGILYGAWVALQQTDMKKLVAYSSVSHLGFVVLGILAFNPEGLMGASLQMVNHGLSTGGLFLAVGMLYERRHSRNFSDYGGIAKIVPWIAIFLVFVACSSMAVPGLNGFVGEFMILRGFFKASPLLAGVAVTGVVFGAAYLLVFLRKVLFGPCTQSENRTLADMNGREAVAALLLVVWMIVLGVAPKVLTSKVEKMVVEYPAKLQPKTTVAMRGERP